MTNENFVEKGIEKLIKILKDVKWVYFNYHIKQIEREVELQKLSSYFIGVADMLSLITGKKYQWSIESDVPFSIMVEDYMSGEKTTIYT